MVFFQLCLWIDEIFPYGSEMVGIARAIDRPANRILLANMIYEMTACTVKVEMVQPLAL